MRRMQSAFAQNVRGHGRGRRLAVHTSDDDAAPSAQDRGERFGATHGRFALIARTDQNWIVDLDRRGKNNQLSVFCMFGFMFSMKAQAESLQSIRLLRAQFVGAANFVAKFEQERSHTTHATAGDANEMDLVPLARKKLAKVRR